MAAFKNLNSQDIIVSPLELNKSFKFIGSEELLASNVNIERYLGRNSNFLENKEETGIISTEFESLVYHQTKQLYYSNYISGSSGDISYASTASFNPDTTVTGEVYSTLYDNFLSTNLNPNRYFPTASNSIIGVMSIPQYLFGDYIQPNSLLIEVNGTNYVDDGEGAVKIVKNGGSLYVGNIIYEHGIIIITGGTEIGNSLDDSLYGDAKYGAEVYGGIAWNESYISDFITETNITCSFSSSYTIHETQFKCTIGESEFNFTQNPSIIYDNEGNIQEFATQDYFTPYVTTVGLYNKNKELMAVAKLSQPLKVSKTTDTTILINIDKH